MTRTDRGDRWSLLTKFSVLSLACFLVLGVVMERLLSERIRTRALDNAGLSAQLVADGVMRPQLRPVDLARGVPESRRRALDRIIADLRTDGRVARVKVWSRDGRIVYSDAASEVGRRFEVEEDLRGAFAGRDFVTVADGGEPEQRAERGLGRLMEAYVPLRFSPRGRPAGAFELYLPYGPVESAIKRDTRTMAAALAVGLLLLYLVLFRIVARASRRLRRQAEETRYQAQHDPLTGLPNRRCLYHRLDEVICAARGSGDPAALLLADLDGFKELNDTLGHHAGDVLLAELGPRLLAALDDVELVARIGGDEFAVLLAPGAGPVHARGVAHRLRASLEEPFQVEDVRLSVQASVGIACFPAHGEDADTLLQRADVAMYEAKRTRAGIEAYTAVRDLHSRERLVLAADLRRALAEGELVPWYQPQAELPGGEVKSVEALLRWEHPERGVIEPARFLAVAEQSGLMPSLTLHVIRHALSQWLAWSGAGLELCMAVNIASANLIDLRFPGEVTRLLEHHGTPPSRLRLEITENTVLADPTRTSEVLGRLHELGVRISLDDFGTGYSSLAHLKTLAVDELKIDRSFVGRMQVDEEDAAIVRATVELARNFGLRVVAEGVEDEGTLTQLELCGCDAVQGYLISRPARARELTRWLVDRRDRSSTPPLAAKAVARGRM